MPTPCIPNPYAALACFALARPLGDISEKDIEEAATFALKIRSSDPPLLKKFLGLYPPQNPMGKSTVDRVEEAEGLLQCIWRGDYDGVHNPEAGPYVHFKGETYLCYGKALLLQGPKEEPAVVYSNKGGDIFVRPLKEWVEIVKWPDGKYRPRFTKEK
jgi:hypothetical protein